MTNCNSNINPGAGMNGSGVTWDFSVLQSNGTSSVTTYLQDNSSFTTSNILAILPDGRKAHLQENNTDTYLNGIEDPSTGTTTYYYASSGVNNNYQTSKRPFTYQTAYTDTYRVIVPSPYSSGTGYITARGDAYGTLILPTGTFTNVLRIKTQQSESDTVNGAFTNTTTTTYMWFDAAHAAPLLRIDTVFSLYGSRFTLSYLAAPTAVRNVSGQQRATYNGHITSNELTLTGDFEIGLPYDIIVYNMIGAQVFTTSITAYSNTPLRFDMGKQINPGIYMVSITQKNDPTSKEIIKVVKQ
jgi:hypothetical protein